MKPITTRLVAHLGLAGWAILCIAALAGFLYEVSILESSELPGVEGELELKLTLQLLILNLPISLLPVALSPLLPDFGVGPVLEWSLLVFLGFIQWTIIVPFVIERGRQVWTKLGDAPGGQTPKGQG